ncbi:hypothetical protein ABZV31_19420 [Streptomyces sp. NPDC005202]|uniref:hypothetical protein n=1 Tax=Streptomyces sp. NPDC005202 TaxID=3157021 RepID=UPI0033B65F27
MMYVAERVAPYKRVRMVTFIDAVPRAASGKILRRELRNLREQQQRELKEQSCVGVEMEGKKVALPLKKAHSQPS